MITAFNVTNLMGLPFQKYHSSVPGPTTTFWPRPAQVTAHRITSHHTVHDVAVGLLLDPANQQVDLAVRPHNRGRRRRHPVLQLERPVVRLHRPRLGGLRRRVQRAAAEPCRGLSAGGERARINISARTGPKEATGVAVSRERGSHARSEHAPASSCACVQDASGCVPTDSRPTCACAGMSFSLAAVLGESPPTPPWQFCDRKVHILDTHAMPAQQPGSCAACGSGAHARPAVFAAWLPTPLAASRLRPPGAGV
eukprot:SAG22_NODE_1008_length_6054_cov_11.023678_12_plen_254_part_00